MSLDAAQAALDDMTYRARKKLRAYRNNNLDDEQFLRDIITEFVRAARTSQPPAGAVHMALSLYRLATQHDRITELEDALDMRDKALELMFKLSDEGNQ
jgi:hypothetical protein